MKRLYLDTSVFCFDKEFMEWTLKLIEEIKMGLKTVVISDLTLKELKEASINIRNLVNEIPEEYKEYVTLNDEAYKLAEHYIEEGIVSEVNRVDAQHIAIATVNKIDVLVSWDFRHIVNTTKMQLYNYVNLKYNYPQLEIKSPRELLSKT